MEAAELLPRLVSSACPHARPPSSALPSSPQATRKRLPMNGAFSNCQACSSSSSLSSSTLQATSKHSSSSPLQRVKSKNFSTALSDCQQQKFSLSSSSSTTQHAARKHLHKAFLDFQVQASLSSPSIQLVRREHLPRAFTNFQASSSSPASIAHHRKREQTRAFIDYLTEGFSSLSLTQCSRQMHLPMAFSNHHEHFILSVRTMASVGRLSGAFHGSNSRKGRHRKRSDSVHQGNNQDLEKHSGKEIVNKPISEDIDSHMFCDDVPFNKDSDCDIYCENAPCIDENYMYDSIHGDLWQTDPYYQEFETISRQEEVLDGSTPDRSNDMSIVGEKNTEEKSGAGSQNDEYLTAVQGGKGAAIAYELMHISVSSSVFPATATECLPSPCNDTYKSVQGSSSFDSVTESTVQNFVGTLERDNPYSLDPESSLSQQDERGKDMVREVGGGERPSASFGSLQCVEGTYLESRQSSGNSEVDGADLEGRSSNGAAVNVVIDSAKGLTTSNVGASVNSAKMSEESGDPLTVVTDVDDSQTLPVAEQVGQVVEQMADFISDSIKEQVVNVVDQVEKFPAQVSQVAEQVMLNIVDQLPDPVVEQAGQVAEQVSQTAEQFVEQVASQVVEPISSTASQIVNFLSSDDDDMESDNEFEAYASLDIPEFKGRQGLNNFTILQEQGIISIFYDFYIFMLKRSLFEFMLGMFAAPVLLSMIFTVLYLPEFSGLALDETVREFLRNADANAKEGLPGLKLTGETVFQVFMFSLSLSTGLQPELAPMSPYTLVVANLNALIAQLIFVFLSGAVFARLSQPSQPVKCSTIAIICPPPTNRRLRKEACHKALLTRYVLVGPQPCELVDVKVDLTYNYNTVTRSGTYFRTSQSLKLVRPEIAFLNNGMLVRHIIDETSPLYQRTQGMLEKEDAVFSLSVVGLERSSMQSVFHVQHYCVYDKDVIWDAEFVDMILISKKNRRVVDHSLLSTWRTVITR